MSKLRVAVGVVSIAAVATFRGGRLRWQEERRRVRRRRINVTMTSFPDYVDPSCPYTLEGWEVLWNTYTPLLTTSTRRVTQAPTWCLGGLGGHAGHLTGRQDLQS